MTDLLENTDTTEAPPASSANASTPFPPPPPKSLDDGPDRARQRVLAVVGAIALLAAVVMGLLWVSALNSRDDAAAERDAAQTAATAESDRTADALDSLATTKVDLDTARTENEQLAAELAAAEADAAAAAAATARADEAEDTLAVVNVENEELAAQIVTLEASLADSQAAAEAAAETAADAPTAPAAPAAPAVFDINAAPDFARYIGEELSSSNGPSVLGQGQTTCLGTAVVNDIGLDALGSGLQSGASSSKNAVVVEAIERAAVSCGIDPSAIF